MSFLIDKTKKKLAVFGTGGEEFQSYAAMPENNKKKIYIETHIYSKKPLIKEVKGIKGKKSF